jgi:hypothetical protein
MNYKVLYMGTKIDILVYLFHFRCISTMCNIDGDMSLNSEGNCSTVSATPSSAAAPGLAACANDKGHKDSCDDSALCRPVSHRGKEKCWLLTLCNKKLGLSHSVRTDLQKKHHCVNQVHMVAMA